MVPLLGPVVEVDRHDLHPGFEDEGGALQVLQGPPDRRHALHEHHPYTGVELWNTLVRDTIHKLNWSLIEKDK